MNRYSRSLILNLNLAHLSRRTRLVNNDQFINNLSTNLIRSPICSKSLVLNNLNSNLSLVSNQRNYKMAFQNSRGLAKDFKKSPRKSSKKREIDPSTLFKSVKIMPNSTNDDEPNLGEELGGKLEKHGLNKLFISFRESTIAQSLAAEKGINSKMFQEAVLSFRQFCLQSKQLPVDLHIKLSDIIKNAANESDLFPYFLQHAYKMFPHLNCMEDLKRLSDLTEPTKWYAKARETKRKIIYHAGPTNSGKTFSALQQFQTSKSGVYCGPLKLLASEVFNKTNQLNTKCDLITGEERKFANDDCTPSDHVACTVEMVNLDKDYDVAVIDEIQLISDLQRGWAWTRALLGLNAKEIHVCGDLTAIDIISDLAFLCGDTLEVKNYKRLTQLNIMNKALETFDAVEPGDCIVCFNKNDIFNVTNLLEKKGHDVAVIYGSMPPGVKMTQAARFNDPNDKCKILVATDAIGMGLNLSIRRIIFYSIKKPQTRDDQDDNKRRGEPNIEYITTSQALQIAGRAGRFNTSYADGFVTTFFRQDLNPLKEILSKPMQKTTKAGLHPTADQIELFAYQLPNHSLSDLLQIFMSICKIDNAQYFMCNFEEIKNLAELIDHIPIPIRAKYTFAISPISLRHPFISSCFVKFVRAYSNNDPVTIDYLKSIISWPLKMPSSLNELIHLENVFDVLDLYLWLGFRFPVIFSQASEVIQLRSELEQLIFNGVRKLLSKENTHQRLTTKNINYFKFNNTTLKVSETIHENSIREDINSPELNANEPTNINNLLNRMRFSNAITKLNQSLNDSEKLKESSHSSVKSSSSNQMSEETNRANEAKSKYDELKDYVKDNKSTSTTAGTVSARKESKKSSKKDAKSKSNLLDLSIEKLQQKLQRKQSETTDSTRTTSKK